MEHILKLVAEVVSIATDPKVIAAGIDVVSLVSAASAALRANEAPDDADWQDLNAKIEALRTRLHTDPPAPAA